MAYTKNIVNIFSYLIGFNVEKYGTDERKTDFAKPEKYEELDKIKAAKIVRCLCMIRNGILNNFNRINHNLKGFVMGVDVETSWLFDYISEEDVRYLESEGIRIFGKSTRIRDWLIETNRHIGDRINNCKYLFPEYVDWKLVKNIFIMPNGLTDKGCKEAGECFAANKTCYPFACYMNWHKPVESKGTALFNDYNFMSLLYEDNNMKFGQIALVCDGYEDSVNTVSDFLRGETEIIVDCENANPFFIYSFLNRISDDDYNYIKKVLLFIDPNASTAWTFLKNKFKGIEFEEVFCERLLNRKSLVDARLITKTVKEYYENHIHSFILVSSDSDFYGMVQELDAEFLLVVERESSANEMIEKIEKADITYIYVEDFPYEDAYDFKKSVITADIKQQMMARWKPLNLKEAIENIAYDTYARLNESERKAITDTICKRIKVDFSDLENVKIVLD